MPMLTIVDTIFQLKFTLLICRRENLDYWLTRVSKCSLSYLAYLCYHAAADHLREMRYWPSYYTVTLWKGDKAAGNGVHILTVGSTLPVTRLNRSYCLQHTLPCTRLETFWDQILPFYITYLTNMDRENRETMFNAGNVQFTIHILLYLFVSVSACLSVHLFACLSVFLFIHPFICFPLSVCLLILLSVWTLSVCWVKVSTDIGQYRNWRGF